MHTEDGDPDSDDEEIELGGATQNFTCPLTLQPLEDPLCSRVCPHAYSRAAILQYVGAGSGKKKCPASGCAHMLGRGDLQEDKAFERRVRDHTRREAEKKEKAAAAQSKDGALDIDDDDDE
jgi:SUMO ligase MMS21 Smc5/6 complex component